MYGLSGFGTEVEMRRENTTLSDMLGLRVRFFDC